MMRITKFTSVLFLATTLMLTGCTYSRYGNYSEASLPANSSMANDTVTYLASQYPPGRTTFNMKQTANDAFGVSLLQFLRSRGYAVKEYTPQNGTTATGTTLGYVVNTLMPNTYQITVYAGNTTLSRVFIAATDGKAYPAGPWSKEE